MEELPKIILPLDPSKREKLEKKLVEYKGRLSRIISQRDPKGPIKYISCSDTNYKVEILEKLLDDGIVDTLEFSKEIRKKYSAISGKNYQNAAAVIDDYCKSGGKNLSGGTGLK